MLGAVILGALALNGSSGPLWVSDAAPRAGQSYVAISWTGGGEIACGGSISRQTVPTSVYLLTDPAVVVCVLHIPKGTAGKQLQLGYEISSRTGNLFTHALGSVRPKLIRR